MERDARVELVSGKGKGVSGSVFWIGDNKYGPGKRYGIRGDDGDTYWATEDQVRESSAARPSAVPEGPVPEKGAVVTFRAGGQEVVGEVFWVGQSKSGPGHRLGVRDADGATHWVDAKFAKPTRGPLPASAHETGRGLGGSFEEEADVDLPQSAIQTMDDADAARWLAEGPPPSEAPSWTEDDDSGEPYDR